MTAEHTAARRAPWSRYLTVLAALFVAQWVVAVAGVLVAWQVPPDRLDPHGTYLRISVHHVVQGVLALGLLALAARRGVDVRLRIGDARRGWRLVGAVLLALGAYLVLYQVVLHALGGRPQPVNPALGALLPLLGFQLLLSGPSEELLYRALAIGVLERVRPRTLVARIPLTTQNLVAAVLFSLAHVTWTNQPFALHADWSQLAFCLVLGTVEGVVLERTGSVLYPMAVHSGANVLVTLTALAAG
jgi:membrane protease YdiL (CAAX protease family)